MKSSHIRSGLLAVVFLFGLFAASETFSQTAMQNRAGLVSQPHPVSVEGNHPLAMAHQKLEQAHSDYRKGNIDAALDDLEAASRWLQDPKISGNVKTRDEAAKLADEVENLRKSIKSPTDEHEGTIARIWHRASVLVKHEIQNLERGWKETSTTNKTLKHLLDAKLHLNYAEHELFVSHETKKSSRDLNKAIAYMDEAYKVAAPEVREKIASIRVDLQKLSSNQIGTSEQKKIFNALDTARASLDGASQGVTPLIQVRLRAITSEIEDLKERIGILERQAQYEMILKKVRELIRGL